VLFNDGRGEIETMKKVVQLGLDELEGIRLQCSCKTVIEIPMDLFLEGVDSTGTLLPEEIICPRCNKAMRSRKADNAITRLTVALKALQEPQAVKVEFLVPTLPESVLDS
jgi:hypothetical protein